MDTIERKDRNLAVAGSIIYLLLIGLIMYMLIMYGLANLQDIHIVNVSSDIFGMFTGFMLFVCCLIDVQKNGSNLKYLMYLINVTFLFLFSDACSWLVEGNPKLVSVNILVNTLYYLCVPISVCFLWMYMSSIINYHKPFERTIGRLIQFGVIIPVALRLVNLFTGIYFTVDANGVYSRSQMYPVSMTYYLLVLIAIAFMTIIERKQLQPYQMVAVMLYILAPFAASIFNILFYGLSVTGPVIMLILMLMYCVLNVSQGRQKAIEDRDMKVAAQIQENILPRTFPYLPEREEFDIYATMTPAKDVGGDFYDFFMIDDDHLAFVVADVSGKGMPAALFMMVSRTLIKNQAQSGSSDYDPKKILAEVNDQLCEGNTMQYFVTAWLGILTLSTGQLDYASAGHEYPAISKDGHDFVIYKERNSPPLGTMNGISFRGGSMTLGAGDIVYVYTDGVAEATNEKNELFGIDRMLDAINADLKADLKVIDTAVRDSVKEFVGEAPQFDDITMLTLRYNGVSKAAD